MSLSMNFHPIDGKWEGVQVEIYPAEHGACIVIGLDDKFTSNDIAIHYGPEENREGFIKMVQKAFSKLTQREEEKKDGRTNKI